MSILKQLPTWLSWLPLGEVPQISCQQLNQNSEQYLLLDVRTHLEFIKSHIPGAISIPLHSLNQKQIDLLSSDKPIVCICLSAHRSKPATRKLLRAGFNVQELQGGMLSWWKQKLPTE